MAKNLELNLWPRYIKRKPKEIPPRPYFFLLVYQYIDYRVVILLCLYIILAGPNTEPRDEHANFGEHLKLDFDVSTGANKSRLSSRKPPNIMRTIFFIGLYILPFLVCGQSEKDTYRDSLENILNRIEDVEREQRDSEMKRQKVDVLTLLSREYDGIDSAKTFDYVHEALDLSRQIGYKKGEAYAYFTLGRAWMYLDPNKALENLQYGDTLASRLKKRDTSKALLKIWANGIYNLGLTHGYLDNNKKELELTEEVIPVVESLQDSLFLANIYSNLGSKYLNLGNHEEGYKNLVIGRSIYRSLGNPQQTTYNIIQLAMAYEGLDSLDRMGKSLEEAKILLEKHPDPFDIFNYGLQESQYLLKTDRPLEALKTLDSIVPMVEGNKNSFQYGIVMQRYSKAYEKLQDYEKASNYVTAYLENAKARNSNYSIYQGHYNLAKYKAELRDYKAAYNELWKALDIYGELDVANISAKLKELNLKYETAEKEKEILQLQVKNEEKKSQGYLLGGLASILALALFIAFYAYTQKLRKARKKELVQQAEVQLLKQEQQNKIFSAMIEGQEKERKRLAIDLHDGLGGRLSGISLNLSKLDKDEPKEYPKKQLRKVMKDLDDSLSELRAIARNMMPETLVKFGLQAALKDYCSSMTGGETKVTLQFYGSDKGIELNQQVTMYRVIQELINNAIKHAHASEVLVQYMREGNQVDITVEDNGVGFKKEIAETVDSGMGLSNLKTRVAYLKGEMDFQSEENEGTTVNVHINIDDAA